MLATDLRKQKTLDANQETIQQINFTGILENNATIFFIIEKAKKTILNFSKVIVRVLRTCSAIYFALI